MAVLVHFIYLLQPYMKISRRATTEFAMTSTFLGVALHSREAARKLVSQPNGAVQTEWRCVYGIIRETKSDGQPFSLGNAFHRMRVLPWQIQASCWVCGKMV